MATRIIRPFRIFQPAPIAQPTERVVFGKTARTLLFVIGLVLAPYVLPGLSRYRLLPANLWRPFSITQLPSTDLAQIGASESEIGTAMWSAKPGEIEDPSGHALDTFFAALSRTETEGRQTRVCHYGDSPITNDGITSTVRRKLQERFGDAGHGFVLAGKPWGWYAHAGVEMNTYGEWEIEPMFISRGDRLFGLGGATFKATASGATSNVSVVDEEGIKHAVSAFDIYFLAQPGGGEFDIEIDGRRQVRVSTASDTTRSDFQRLEVPEGKPNLTMRVAGNGEVRLFGVALERQAAGVQYDSLGGNGAFIGLLDNYLDESHWAEQLRHRKPDLVVIGYGTNESQFEKLPMDQYEHDTREVVRRIRAALPEVSILFVAPMDRGMRGAGGQIVTRPMVKKLVAYQRRLAAELNCAFFDTFTAMGGDGTVAKWFDTRPRLMGGDFTHPTAQGAEIVGSLLYDAIVGAYENYRPADQ